MGYMLDRFYNFISIFQLIGILMIGIMLFFVLRFNKKEANMIFRDKIKLIRKLIRIVLIVYIIGYILSLEILIFIGANFNFESNGITLMVVMTLIEKLVELIFYYLIFRQYLVLIKNFEQDIIFSDDNVVALKKIAKYMLWILVFNLIVILGGYIINLLISQIILSGNTELLYNLFGMYDININTNINFDIIVKFIICIAINIVSIVFEKAYDLYEENRLTI